MPTLQARLNSPNTSTRSPSATASPRYGHRASALTPLLAADGQVCTELEARQQLGPVRQERGYDVHRVLHTVASDPRLVEVFDAVDEARGLLQQLKTLATTGKTYQKMVPLLNIVIGARDTRHAAQRNRVLRRLFEDHEDTVVRNFADVLARDHQRQRNVSAIESVLATATTALTVAGGLGAAVTIPVTAASQIGTTGSNVVSSATTSALKTTGSQVTVATTKLVTKRQQGAERLPTHVELRESEVLPLKGHTPAVFRDPAKVRALLRYLGAPPAEPMTLADQGALFEHEVARIELKNRLGCGAGEDLARRTAHPKSRRGGFGRLTMDEYLDADELEAWRTLKRQPKRRGGFLSRRAARSKPIQTSTDMNVLALFWKSEGLFQASEPADT